MRPTMVLLRASRRPRRPRRPRPGASVVVVDASTTTNINSSNGSSSNSAIISTKQKHDELVAQLQAKILATRQQQQQQQQQPPQQLHSPSFDWNVLRNNIQHWLSKDPSFFVATMQALELREDFWNHHRPLYYDSLVSFREQQKQPPQQLSRNHEALVEAGFGTVDRSKAFRTYRGLELQRQGLEEHQDKLRATLKHQQAQFQRLESLLLVANRGQEPPEETTTKRRRTRTAPKQPVETATKNEETTASWFASKISALTSWWSTSPAPTNNSPSPSPTDDEKEALVASEARRTQEEFERRRLQRSFMDIEVALDDTRHKLHRLNQRQASVQQQLDHLMTPAEFQHATSAVEKIRDPVCKQLAQHIQERHTQLIQQYQQLDQQTVLTKPHEWFPFARLDRRTIIFHGGPTNSGKTYAALQRLKQARRGLYLGPLRLLAAEIYESLTADGKYTNLYTGQERREIAFSTHSSATVEMASLDKEYDVVVIDEIQMIADVTRGAAWTKALLGLRCKEIHVCGGLEAKKIVQKIARACGDDFSIKKYERFSELQVASTSLSRNPKRKGDYRQVETGDCIVAFSRNDIFDIKREIEKTTNHKCCVIYGKLPPTTRAAQARLFNDPGSGYDVLVASDAIGMGLNLNIKRIVFNSIFKYNGEAVARLSHSEIKQIAGRAGRRNSPYPNGEVTCRDPRDLPYIRQCMNMPIPTIAKAALLPTAAHIELFSSALQSYGLNSEEPIDLHSILRQFSAMATVQGDYFFGRQTELRMIAKRLKNIPIPLRYAYTMCLSPTTEGSLALLETFAWKLALGEVVGLPSRSVPKPARSFDDLSYLCGIYGDADLFLWLQFKFPPSNAVEYQAAVARKEQTLEFINEALANTEKLELNHCYIKQATRLRAVWEAENSAGESADDSWDEGGDYDADSDEEEAVYL